MGTLLIRNVVRDGVPCDIYIKEGVISSIGRGLDLEADTVLDGGGKTVMPAFVNMHTHSGMTLFRGICEDMPLSRWLDAVWKAETRRIYLLGDPSGMSGDDKDRNSVFQRYVLED